MSPVVRTIQIDASAHCQLACPSCPTASGATAAGMKPGHLDPAAFQSLLDANPHLTDVELSNYGEMFLNPKLTELLRIAYDRGVVIHADNGVNLNHASPETLESLVRYRVRSMTVSIDGASAETYAQYRRKGNFDRVIDHITQINEFKSKHRSMFPLLVWQFIVFGHNEHEIEAARSKAAELGMRFKPKISWDDDFSPVRDPELVQIRAGLHSTREDHYKATGAAYTRAICHQLWNAPVLNWDGRVMGCCRNFWGDFGADAFRDGLSASLETPKLQQAREALMGRAPMDSEIPCATCDLFQTMERDGNWIAPSEVTPSGNPSILTSIVPVRGTSPATHVDIFVAPGHEVNRLLLARSPQATRIELGLVAGALVSLPAADYMVYALPKQLDPTYRKQYPALPPVTMPIRVSERPIVCEFQIPIG
jgi:radical SAM family protein